MKGVDGDVQFVVLPGLTLNGGAAFLNGQYTNYPNPVVYPPSPYDPPINLANAAGKQTVNSPRWTANFGATYTFDVPLGEFYTSVNGSYNSGYFFDSANLFPQRSYALLDTSAGWTNPSGRYGITIWGKNLTNSFYLLSGVASGVGYLQVPAAPRTYGVTLHVKF